MVMDIDFSQFDTEENLKQIRKDANKAVVDREFEEVPPGTYEVALSKLELTKSQKGNLMVAVWYTILSGDYENQKIFQYQVVSGKNDGDKIRRFKPLLDKLSDNEIDTTFTSYVKYAELLDEIMEFSEDNNLEYSLKYDEKVSKDGKVFKTYKILEVFEGE